MTSTIGDLGVWAASLSGSDLLSEATRAARLETGTDIGVAMYGLGIYQVPGGWYGHDGDALGWQAVAVHNPDKGVSVAMASNSCAAGTIYY